MKRTLITTILFLSLGTIYAQTSIESLVKEGVQYHDNGNYEKAIETYLKALEIDPQSLLVNYEIAFSYFSNGEYQKSIMHSDVILEQNSDLMLQAYITKGSSLDLLGKTDESIKLLEKAIRESEEYFLLFYNLAINYFKIDEYEKAEFNVVKAIENNQNHASSHLLLAEIHNEQGNSIQTLLASHFFLFLEPSTQRSTKGLSMLYSNFGNNVSRDKNRENSINITMSPNSDSDFGGVELMLSILVAANNLEENSAKSKDELFIENTTSLFNLLGELENEDKEEIWWTFYIPFYYKLAQSEHIETYCKYITMSGNNASAEWLVENESKLDEFGVWLQNN